MFILMVVTVFKPPAPLLSPRRLSRDVDRLKSSSSLTFVLLFLDGSMDRR